MARNIDYVFSLISPWAYLGSARFHAMAKKHGVSINYRPVSLPAVFSETGGLPLAKRPPTRQAYRLMEMQRWRDHLGIPLLLKPKYFPVDVALADRCVVALCAMEADPQRYIEAAHAALWAEDRDLADEAVLAAVLTATGQDAALVLGVAKGNLVEAVYAAHGDWTIKHGVFGSPSYVLDGEIFWGQDRLHLLEEALESGRGPYLP
jgi:2-hydroxychromene-2-carboxylate isomerase